MSSIRFEGLLEIVDSAKVRGWAWAPGEAAQHLTVSIVADGRTLGTVTASRFREDLRVAGIGDGDHAFALDFDSALAEEDVERIEAHVRLGDASLGLLKRAGRPANPPAQPAPPPVEPVPVVAESAAVAPDIEPVAASEPPAPLPEPEPEPPQPAPPVVQDEAPASPAPKPARVIVQGNRRPNGALTDVFVHVPKTSGSTIRSIISRQYGAAATLYFEPDSIVWEHRANPMGYLAEQFSTRDVALITGHHRFGVHEFVRQKCRYFTMVRDPIDRTISDFFYAYTFPDHRNRDEIRAGTYTFEHFVADPVARPAMAHTYLLAGTYAHLDGPTALAVQHIRSSFAAVGTTERFDQSILRIARRFGWKPPIYLRKNVTALDPKLKQLRSQVSEMAHTTLADAFASDYAIYDAANAELTRWLTREGEAFLTVFDAFKRLQAKVAELETSAIHDRYNLEEDDPLPPSAMALHDTRDYQIVAEYLAAGEEDDRPTPQYVGFIDKITPTSVEGWAIDLSTDAPIDVALYSDGKLIDWTKANRRRADVASVGYDRAEVGYRFDLPAGVDPATVAVGFDTSRILLTPPR